MLILLVFLAFAFGCFSDGSEISQIQRCFGDEMQKDQCDSIKDKWICWLSNFNYRPTKRDTHCFVHLKNSQQSLAVLE